MRIEKHRNKFVAYIPFSMKENFRDGGWLWDKDLKKWITFDIKKAALWHDFAVGVARKELDDYKSGLTGAVADSMKEESDFHVPTPDGLSLLPFQIAGVEYAVKRKDTLIADPPGLGKTVQAISFGNYIKARRVLVICPSYLKVNWSREYKKWDMLGLSVGIATTVQKDKLGSNGDPLRKPAKEKGRLGAKIKYSAPVWPDTDVVIIHDNLMPVFYEKIQSIRWDLFIADEVQAYTNAKAARSTYVWGGGAGKKRVKRPPAKRRMFLTGTPITKNPYNMWVFCMNFDYENLGRNWKKFIFRYCAAYKDNFGLHWDGASNLEELNFKLREAFMVRRDKVSVLKDLPPKRRELIVLPDDGLAKQVAAEVNYVGEMMKDFEAMVGAVDLEDEEQTLDALQNLFPSDTSNMSYEDIADLMTNEQVVAFDEISELRKKMSIAKIPLVKNHVDNLLQGDEKIIIFCHHKAVADELHKHYPDAAFITGKVHADDRQAQVDRFQEEDDCRLIIGNIGAAGTGFTMTAASIVVFAELVWLPHELEQAEDRAWRIGQENPVLIQHLVVQGSLDARFINLLLERMDMQDRALSPEKALQR